MDLFNMLTVNAGQIWKLPGYVSSEKLPGDMVIAKAKKHNALESFFDINPEDILLVIHKGMIRLFDECLYEQLALGLFNMENFTRLTVYGANKFVQGNITALIKEIRRYYPEAVLPIAEEKLFA